MIFMCGLGFKMIGSLITRVLVLIFGYVYPAYECFKSVEMNKPDIDQLRFWCQYWILVAGLTVGERIGDAFVGWVPMYGEAKLAFFIYLWFPKTKGTTYVYDSFFRPYVAKHEPEIDRNLIELRTRAGDMVILYWQRAASYGQTRIFEILQYIASQSPPSKPPQQQGTRVEKPNVPSKPTQPQDDGQPSSPASNTTSSSEQQEDDTADEAGPSEDSKAAPTDVPPPSLNEQKTTPSQSLVERTKSLNSDEGKTVRIESAVPNGNKELPAQEVTLAEALRVTRASCCFQSRLVKANPSKGPENRKRKWKPVDTRTTFPIHRSARPRDSLLKDNR
ncbi:hva22-like protein i [Phtheirospermum japonicum]|uniref:HVA22-like protein n=1 Tax=Phtheirospermum japonicum TaxID=374723 RepID=A0A830C3H3_9LAMI|nr:hva22-like protein i [Phtheirospermum japonicum]